MNDELNLRIYLTEAIQEKNWSLAWKYSQQLINSGYFIGRGRKGWRVFECEKYKVKFSHGEEEYGCGCKFMLPTRDFSSPSLDTCPKCNEECHPDYGFYDEKLTTDNHFNLTNTPESIKLN